MTLFLSVAIIVLTILALYSAAFDNAQEGWEDDDGFHAGSKPRK